MKVTLLSPVSELPVHKDNRDNRHKERKKNTARKKRSKSQVLLAVSWRQILEQLLEKNVYESRKRFKMFCDATTPCPWLWPWHKTIRLSSSSSWEGYGDSNYHSLRPQRAGKSPQDRRTAFKADEWQQEPQAKGGTTDQLKGGKRPGNNLLHKKNNNKPQINPERHSLLNHNTTKKPSRS